MPSISCHKYSFVAVPTTIILYCVPTTTQSGQTREGRDVEIDNKKKKKFAYMLKGKMKDVLIKHISFPSLLTD